jgi:hypothetical protein
VKHNSTVKTNCIVSIRTINHQSPLIIVACLKCSKWCLMTFSAARAYKRLDWNTKLSIVILRINRHTVCCSIDHNFIDWSIILRHCNYHAAFQYNPHTQTYSKKKCNNFSNASNPQICFHAILLRDN